MKTLKSKTVKVDVHSFYCDECGKYLGDIEEYDNNNGWCEELGSFEMIIPVGGSWYWIKKCLCTDCRSKMIKQIQSSLTSLGFVEAYKS